MSMEKACKMAGEWWAARLNDVYANKREDFAKRVTELCLEQAKIQPKGFYTEVDYDPDSLLLIAVKELIDPNCRGFLFSARGILPQKHSLCIQSDKLTSKEGYGNWTAIIPVEE